MYMYSIFIKGWSKCTYLNLLILFCNIHVMFMQNYKIKRLSSLKLEGYKQIHTNDYRDL